MALPADVITAASGTNEAPRVARAIIQATRAANYQRIANPVNPQKNFHLVSGVYMSRFDETTYYG